MINTPPISGPFVSQDGRVTLPVATWLNILWLVSNSISESGTTSQRPTTNLWVGRPFFDTTLGKPVFWDGSAWVYWLAPAADSANSSVSVSSADASTVTGTATDSSLGAAFGFASAAQFNNAITAINTIVTLANEQKGDINQLVTDVNDLKTKLRNAGIMG